MTVTFSWKNLTYLTSSLVWVIVLLYCYQVMQYQPPPPVTKSLYGSSEFGPNREAKGDKWK